MRISLLTLCLLASVPTVSQAEWTLTPYAGIGFEKQVIGIDDVDFDTSQLMLHAGVWVWEGIGFELEIGQGLSDDTQNTLTLEHNRMLRYGVRLATPPSESKTVLYVLLSGATSTIDLGTATSSNPGESSFDGYHAGIGMGTQITPRVQLDLSYNNYQIDESFDMSGLRLNVEFALGGLSR